MSTDLFDLPDADILNCRVWKYSVTHSTLTLRVTKHDQQVAGFRFHDVAYFSGPMYWRSARIQVAEQHEMITLMKRLGLIGSYGPRLETVLDYQKLYLIHAKSPSSEIEAPLTIYILGTKFVSRVEESLITETEWLMD